MRIATCKEKDVETRVKDAARQRYGKGTRLQLNPHAFAGPERIAKTLRWADLIKEYGIDPLELPFDDGLSEARGFIEAARNVVSVAGSAESVAALASEVIGFEKTIDKIEVKISEIEEMRDLGSCVHWRRHLITHRSRVVAAADSLEELLQILSQ